MRIISHRGNLHGPNTELENSPNYILAAEAAGYDVEVDVWLINGKWFLGHDDPVYLVDDRFLLGTGIWCHAKNVEALEQLREIGAHVFWHQNDSYTITSLGIIWAYPGFPTTGVSVIHGKDVEITTQWGICTDYAGDYPKNR